MKCQLSQEDFGKDRTRVPCPVCVGILNLILSVVIFIFNTYVE